MNVYVSTSALKNPFNIEEVLKQYMENDIQNIELGSSHDYAENIKEILEGNKEKLNFVVHNYFPPPQQAFALNLAAKDEEIRRKSIAHAMKAIDLCKAINSPIYSIHAGMLQNPSEIAFFEGFSFDNKDILDYDTAYKNLINSCIEINCYARKNKVKFAIENSGGHPSKYAYLLMTRKDDFQKLFKDVDDDNFGLLLDLGHYNVSSKLYAEENILNFIDTFSKKIFQVHVHSNDGSDDQHHLPTGFEIEICRLLPPGTLVTLESMNTSLKDLVKFYHKMRTELSK